MNLKLESTDGFIFSANLQPVSVNKCFKTTQRGRKTLKLKSGDYKRFTTEVEGILNRETYREQRQQLHEAIAGRKYILRTVLTITTPPAIYWTKQGDISSRAGDVSNYRKPIQDIIFKWLGIDDKYSKREANIHTEDDHDLWSITYTIDPIFL